MWHVYFLLNADGIPYVGHTGQTPAERLSEHNRGLNKWTRARRPWKLAYAEIFHTKAEAMRREKFYKTGVGRQLRDEIIAEKS